MIFVDQGLALLHSQVFHKLFFKKSFSISSFPILAKSSFCSTSGSASFLPSKALEEFLRNSRFHCPIWLGWTSKRLASSARVSCSFRAAMATCALKAAVNFLLDF